MNKILQRTIEKLKEREIEFNLIQLKDRAMTVQEVIKFSNGKSTTALKDIDPKFNF